jgi:hypothetical protein
MAESHFAGVKGTPGGKPGIIHNPATGRIGVRMLLPSTPQRGKFLYI